MVGGSNIIDKVGEGTIVRFSLLRERKISIARKGREFVADGRANVSENGVRNIEEPLKDLRILEGSPTKLLLEFFHGTCCLNGSVARNQECASEQISPLDRVDVKSVSKIEPETLQRYKLPRG